MDSRSADLRGRIADYSRCQYGFDSGLPDFRVNEDFWKAYPALKNDRIGFMNATFFSSPKQA